MKGTVTIDLEEYESMRSNLARYRALEDNLTDFILNNLNEEIENIKKGIFKAEWFEVASCRTKNLCEALGYQALFDYKREEIKDIKVEDSGNLE